jgi:hypothetical protein
VILDRSQNFTAFNLDIASTEEWQRQVKRIAEIFVRAASTQSREVACPFD